ncbi:cytochrome c3 family protein [Campylobacter sp. 9BO]|uniref:cytochrome c3 family protein n=1 Tax=Campylobacter sp. 9BO TaxID=3424759 RepID=UPI003D3274F0
MKKILLVMSFFTIFSSANQIQDDSNNIQTLRNSNGQITKEFSEKTFPIKGIHAKLGLTCTDCHKEAEQKDYSSAMNSSCLDCHKSYKKLAEATGHLGHNDNIHNNPHYESLDCDTCHKAHTPTVNMCVRCHTQDSLKSLIVK